MAEWQGVRLGDIEQVSDFAGDVLSVTGTVGELFQVTADILDTLAVFLNLIEDPIASILRPIIDEIEAIINDFLNANVSILTVIPAAPYNQSPSQFLQVISNSFDDIGDPQRPIVGDSGSAGGAILMLTAATIADFKDLITSFNEIFGFDSYARAAKNLSDIVTGPLAILRKDITPSDAAQNIPVQFVNFESEFPNSGPISLSGASGLDPGGDGVPVDANGFTDKDRAAMSSALTSDLTSANFNNLLSKSAGDQAESVKAAMTNAVNFPNTQLAPADKQLILDHFFQREDGFVFGVLSGREDTVYTGRTGDYLLGVKIKGNHVRGEEIRPKFKSNRKVVSTRLNNPVQIDNKIYFDQVNLLAGKGPNVLRVDDASAFPPSGTVRVGPRTFRYIRRDDDTITIGVPITSFGRRLSSGDQTIANEKIIGYEGDLVSPLFGLDLSQFNFPKDLIGVSINDLRDISPADFIPLPAGTSVTLVGDLDVVSTIPDWRSVKLKDLIPDISEVFDVLDRLRNFLDFITDIQSAIGEFADALQSTAAKIERFADILTRTIERIIQNLLNTGIYYLSIPVQTGGVRGWKNQMFEAEGLPNMNSDSFTAGLAVFFGGPGAGNIQSLFGSILSATSAIDDRLAREAKAREDLVAQAKAFGESILDIGKAAEGFTTEGQRGPDPFQNQQEQFL